MSFRNTIPVFPGSPAPRHPARAHPVPQPPPMRNPTARRACVTLAALLTAAACTSEAPTAPSSAAAALAKGGGGGGTPPAPVTAVAGTWTGTQYSATNPGDSTRWSLSLSQKDERVEGTLFRVYYFRGTVSSSASRIKSGSVVGQSLGVTFISAAESADPSFSATVSAVGRSMTGFYSYNPDAVTLTR